MVDGKAELTRRVVQLDAGLDDPGVRTDTARAVAHAVSVLARVTNTSSHRPPVLTPAHADALVANSALVRHLCEVAPESLTGPLARDRQFWVSTGKPPHVTRVDPTLSPARFVAADDIPLIAPSTKPFHLGLFTSTGILGGRGMWLTYLDLHRGSTLFLYPWHVWAVAVAPDAAVREITTAAEWVDFVRGYPLRHDGLTYPDWTTVSQDHDAVHMTLRAVIASQGLRFTLGQTTTAAPYWDVESTLWLRWRFPHTELL